MIFLSVGANDAMHLTHRTTFRHEYRILLSRLPPGCPVVVLGVPVMGALPRLRQPLRALAGWRSRSLDGVLRDLVSGGVGAWRLTRWLLPSASGPPPLTSA